MRRTYVTKGASVNVNESSIIDRLLERDEAVLDELTQHYSKLYKGILREILHDESDVEECANDLLLAVWNSIPPNRPNSLPAYICKIARNIGINRYKYNNRQKRSSGYTVMLSELDGCITDRMSLLRQSEDDESIRLAISDFLRGLDAETRILFVRRYIYLESVTSLSERFEISENHVSVKLFRARKKLKKLLEKEWS